VNARSLTTYIRDSILFGLGIYVAMSETGVPPFQRPAEGPNLWVLVFAGLLCNGPVVLQALALRFGTGGQRQGPEPPQQAQLPESPSVPSSGGN